MAFQSVLWYSMIFHDILWTFMRLASFYTLAFDPSGDFRGRILGLLRSFAEAVESCQAFHGIHSHARYAGGPTVSENSKIFHLAFPAYLRHAFGVVGITFCIAGIRLWTFMDCSYQSLHCAYHSMHCESTSLRGGSIAALWESMSALGDWTSVLWNRTSEPQGAIFVRMGVSPIMTRAGAERPPQQ